MSKRPYSPTSSDHHTSLSFERIVFFSDAVMAIAITLLVIDLKLPDIPSALAAAQLQARLSELTPRIVSFVISFTVVGIYWSSHHRYFTYIKRYDGRLIALNLIFLFFIAMMPFVASLLGQYGYLPIGVVTYGLSVALTGFSIGAIWWYASYQYRLIDYDLDKGYIRVRNRVALVVPIIFLVSLSFAWLSPLITMAMWWLAPIASILVLRILESHSVK